MPSFCHGIYLTYIIFSFSNAVGRALFAVGTTYVISAESLACILVRLNDMLKCKHGHNSMCTVQCSSFADQVSHSAKYVGKAITLPFNFTSKCLSSLLASAILVTGNENFSSKIIFVIYGMVHYTHGSIPVPTMVRF